MLQFLFGRHFWIWIVSFLVAACSLGAISVNQLMRLSARKAYKLKKGKASLSLGNQRRLQSSVILGGRNIFDPNGGMVTQPKVKVKKASKEPKKVKKALEITVKGCPPLDPKKTVPLSKLKRIRLKGTSYAEQDPASSVAAVYVRVVRKVSKASPPPRRRIRRRRRFRRRYRRRRRRVQRRKTRRRYRRRYSSGRSIIWQTEIFRAGEIMMGRIRLCAIGPHEILISNNGKLERFSLLKKKKKRQSRFYGSIGLARPKEDSDGPGQVRVDAVDKRTISRSTVQNWLANPMSHAMSARIMPHYKGGRNKGLRLVWVRKKSLYAQLGLKTGDIVQSVNGKTLNVSNALGLYSQLPYAKNLKVNIIRKGVRRQLFFNIK